MSAFELGPEPASHCFPQSLSLSAPPWLAHAHLLSVYLSKRRGRGTRRKVPLYQLLQASQALLLLLQSLQKPRGAQWGGHPPELSTDSLDLAPYRIALGPWARCLTRYLFPFPLLERGNNVICITRLSGLNSYLNCFSEKCLAHDRLLISIYY